MNVLVGLCLPIAQYFLPSFRERVGVKIGVSNFSAETDVQQEFDAPSLKKRFTESLKALQDNVFGVSMKNWGLTSLGLEWYSCFRFTELHLENQIHQGFWSGRPENT